GEGGNPQGAMGLFKSIPEFGQALAKAGTRCLTLQMGWSSTTAFLLANYVPAVVGMQSVDAGGDRFTIAFYRALLRTGQADFAITEARRALAVIPGIPLAHALSPVLYLSVAVPMVLDPYERPTSA